MLILMKQGATPEQIEGACKAVRDLGYTPHPIPGAVRTAIGITGNKGPLEPTLFTRLEGVADAVPVSQPFKLVSREVKPETTVIDLGNVKIGDGSICVMAGPCAVEGREQLVSTAEHVAKHGARMLRGGAFKPRTSPYDFQGLREEGLALLAEAREKTGLPIITEVKDTESLEKVAEVADVLQIGARNMQNFSLLEAVGEAKRPVMLKRGLSSTIKEWLMAAEYIVSRGNRNVILCERGIRTFETATRNTLDLGMVPMLRAQTHLPIVIDPSHGCGYAKGVPPLARAAVALGVDGVMVEVHPDPSKALSDGPQSLNFPAFEAMMKDLEGIARAIGQTL
ncbi:MAG TPA: 3-deoxy-7-phosphoheptulonate synthase [Minicystis sp.]|nr:3-deoxy-7-phosphoheptulonate synthase [Minicystis sp.]